MNIQTLESVCSKVTSGGTPSRQQSSYWQDGTIPWLKTGDIKKNFIYSVDEFITNEGLDNSSAKLIPVNSIIIAMYGDGNTAGSVAVNKIELATNQACCNFIIDEEKADYRFIYHYLKGSYQNLVNLKSGGSQQNLNAKTLKNFPIWIPKLETQQKIAGILSAYDELIENNKKRIALLETMAEELYKEWFVRFRFPDYENTEFEIGMPKNWHTELIKNLVDRKRFGKLFKEDEVSEKGNIPVYDQSRDNFFGFYNGEPEHKASFENPIIIFGDHTCKMKILFSDFSLAENVIPLKAKDNVNLNYLFYLIKDSVKTTEYKRHWTELTNKKVLIAPIELQNKFSEIIQGNLKMIDNLVHQNFKLAESRDSLLPRLISGKLSVEHLDIQQPPTPAQPTDSE